MTRNARRLDERGSVAVEVAVLAPALVALLLLVGAAIVVMGIIYQAAKNNANNIPDPEAPAG